MTDDTPANHLEEFKWKAGESGNPKGRPKGARSQLSEAFLNDMYEEWQKGGRDCIQRAMESNPAAMCATIAKLLPKELSVQHDLGDQLGAFLKAIQKSDDGKAKELT